MDDLVSIRLRLAGGQEVAGELRLVNKEIASTGDSATATGRKTSTATTGISRSLGRIRGGWESIKRVAGAGALAITAGLTAIAVWGKHAIDSTENLAKTTLLLHTNLGLTTQDASAWLGVIQAWGGDTTQAALAFKTFSTQLSNANAGSKTAAGNFDALGFSQRDMTKASGDAQFALLKTADGLQHMKAGADKTRIATQLFGRGWKSILPILGQGSKGLEEQLHWAKEYGVTLGGDPIKSLHEMKLAQVQLSLAQQGWQIFFTEKLAPTLAKGALAIAHFTNGMRNGTGAGGQFAGTIKIILAPLFLLAKLASTNGRVLGILVGLFVAYKLGVSAASVATNIAAGASKAMTAAIWLLDAAMAANPVAAIVILVVALGAGLVLAYTKVKWFHNAVNAVFSFIKKHWRLLAGILLLPIIGPIGIIVLNFGRIKGAASAVWRWIKGAWATLGGFIASPFVWAWGKIQEIFAKIKQGVNDIGDTVKSLPGKAVDAVKGAPGSVLDTGKGVVGSLLHHARGGLIPTTSWRIVGEEGPELVRLPGAARVYPSNETASMRRRGQQRGGVRPSERLAGLSAGGESRERVKQPIELRVSGKKLAEVMVTVQDDADARK